VKNWGDEQMKQPERRAEKPSLRAIKNHEGTAKLKKQERNVAKQRKARKPPYLPAKNFGALKKCETKNEEP
jgi:hypothetical protein